MTPSGCLSITDLNAAVFAEFRRITGSTDGFRFPLWWAEQERSLIRLQAPGENQQALASERWSRLTRDEQQRRLLLYLRESPPSAAGPRPRLTIFGQA